MRGTSTWCAHRRDRGRLDDRPAPRLGQDCVRSGSVGCRTIHAPDVDRTSSPTAAIKTTVGAFDCLRAAGRWAPTHYAATA